VKYWPTVKDEPRVCGEFQVQLNEEEKDRGDYITRRFKIFPVDKVLTGLSFFVGAGFDSLYCVINFRRRRAEW